MVTLTPVSSRERWLLVGLLLLAFALRVAALDEAPPGLRYDELQNHLMAGRVLAGERPLYFAESWGHEPLYHYLQAAALGRFGQSDWSLRLPSPYLGLLGVAGLWLLARRLFGPRPALLAAAGLALSFWAVLYSRIGSRVGPSATFVILAVYGLWLAWRRLDSRGWTAAVLGGLMAAAAVVTYVAGRVAPGLIAGFSLYAALFHRRRFRRAWTRLLLCGGLAAALALPMLVTLRQNPGLEQRLDLLNQPLAALRQGNARPVLSLTARAWGMYVWSGEQDWLYNVSGRPIFEPVTATFFLLGTLLAMRRWRQDRYGLLLLWLAGGTAPAMVAPPAASLTHTVAAQPAAMLLLAVGVAWAWRRLENHGRLGPLLAAAVMAWLGLTSMVAYFGVWTRSPAVQELYQGGITAVADAAAAAPGPVLVGAPYIDYWQPWNAVAFDLASATDTSAVRWFNPAGAWVWPAAAADQAPVTYFFPSDPLGPLQLDPALWADFQAVAVPLPGNGQPYTAYRLAPATGWPGHPASAAAGAFLAWPPEMAGRAAPRLPLVFGERLQLCGAVVPTATVAPGQPVRFRTTWEILRADPAPLVAFVHLTPDGVAIFGQQDWLDVRLAGLQPGDRFVQIHTVPVDPAAPPGVYALQLGLYGPDTGRRLPMDAGNNETVDRVWIGQVTIAP